MTYQYLNRFMERPYARIKRRWSSLRDQMLANRLRAKRLPFD